ncbi:MAG: class I SAM-dependent methyltransferase [Spirochaetales bacterium]|nr:class I SAM-dependent methyltransferase [Spirochaetales bacterium]
MSKRSTNFFTEETAQTYDERNRQLEPISKALHFLTRLILENYPENSRVLCVGVGTGADILALAEAFKNWSFVAVEPSLSMLNVCRRRMENAQLATRCEFVHGFVDDVPLKPDFDIATALFVGHFVKLEDRSSFYRGIIDRLRIGGCLINAEISFDLESESFPSMVRQWQSIQRLMGGTDESLKAVPKQLKETLTVLSPEKVEETLRESKIVTPVRFFQALMIAGWYAIKRG